MVRKAYQALDTPTKQDSKALLNMNLIWNAKITNKDIHLAEKVYEADGVLIKGKIVRSQSSLSPAYSNIIEIPSENNENCMKEIYYIYRWGVFNEFYRALDVISFNQDPPIKMSYEATQEHVPRAKQGNTVVQKRVRANYYQLSFTKLPRILAKYMVKEAAENWVISQPNMAHQSIIVLEWYWIKRILILSIITFTYLENMSKLTRMNRTKTIIKPDH